MGKPLHIFLADDDIDDVELFEDTLRRIDPTVVFHSASDGLKAIQFLAQHESPDLIFLDLNMPMADGKKCLQAIKKSDQLRNVPAIIFTTFSFPTDVGECLALGALSFISKPTVVAELRTVLRAIVANIHSDIVGALKQLRTAAGIYY